MEEKDILNFVSSVIFLEEKKISAEEYYKQGLQALELEHGDIISAQLKFANAWHLSSYKNPEYGYLLAKSILSVKTENERFISGARRILEEVLRSKPDYAEAKDLLQQLKDKESSLSSSVKNK